MYMGFRIVRVLAFSRHVSIPLTHFPFPFTSLAEDFEFSQDAWRRGFTCGRVHGIVREQSPTTLRDFLKQRRRWFMGIRDIDGL